MKNREYVKEAPRFSSKLAGAEADKLKKFIDAGGTKSGGCPTLTETDSSSCCGIRFNRSPPVKNLAENNLIRFTNITRKKDAIFANFRVKGLRNGVVFSASISVDITALELHPGDTLEKIVEECARHGIKEFKKSDIQFEGLAAVLSDHLGVAQLG